MALFTGFADTSSQIPTPAHVLLQYLYDEGIVRESTASNPTWSAFLAFEPDQPDECVSGFDTGALKDGRIFRTGEPILHPRVQVRVRGKAGIGYSSSYAKAQEIAVALSHINRTEIEVWGRTYLVQSVMQLGGPVFLREEGTKKRAIWTVNFQVTMQEA